MLWNTTLQNSPESADDCVHADVSSSGAAGQDTMWLEVAGHHDAAGCV